MTRLDMPSLPLTGGCQCGAVRYRVNAAPFVFYLCHCRECQRHTSSAFGESLRVRSVDIEVEGEMKCVTRLSEAGNLREGWFCPQCGVRIVHGTKGAEMVNIKAGTLDDATWLVPAGHIWTRSKQRFFAIGEGELAYETAPKDGLAALVERWRVMLAQS